MRALSIFNLSRAIEEANHVTPDSCFSIAMQIYVAPNWEKTLVKNCCFFWGEGRGMGGGVKYDKNLPDIVSQIRPMIGKL